MTIEPLPRYAALDDVFPTDCEAWVVRARQAGRVLKQERLHFEMSATLVGEQWVAELTRDGVGGWAVEELRPGGGGAEVLGTDPPACGPQTILGRRTRSRGW
jgi:hypothetical protein